MKVKELKKLLEKVDDDYIVIMAKDAEGNGFSPLAELGDSYCYLANSTWSGEIGFKTLTLELIKEGYSEEDIIDGEPALVLWPIN